ncbi:hypothetical protein CYMTET_26228 [Cymbomonas tetramitiformis]|uniref:F-box domain-containing protein n=1 Tax=Cymbomonas tetramitiformis TaxID=36881 RepID=A0AAE0KY50_9CHLO|nr:hypothetical protein CYMTET_26228 [Cymbomonas tetramitiformis]
MLYWGKLVRTVKQSSSWGKRVVGIKLFSKQCPASLPEDSGCGAFEQHCGQVGIDGSVELPAEAVAGQVAQESCNGAFDAALELPGAVWSYVFTFLDAPALCAAERVCPAWRQLILYENHALWCVLTEKIWPEWIESYKRWGLNGDTWGPQEWGPTGKCRTRIEPQQGSVVWEGAKRDPPPGERASAPWPATFWKGEYKAILLGERVIRGAHINRGHTFGTFGCAESVDVSHNRESGGLLTTDRFERAYIVPAGAVRCPNPPETISDGKSLTTCWKSLDMAIMPRERFEMLKENDFVEVQWKRVDSSAQFNWWLAIVQEVHYRTDEVTLRFDQYDAGRDGTLLQLSKVARTGGSSLHGGIAGGLRCCTPEDIKIWRQNMLEFSERQLNTYYSSKKWMPCGTLDRTRAKENMKAGRGFGNCR